MRVSRWFEGSLAMWELEDGVEVPVGVYISPLKVKWDVLGSLMMSGPLVMFRSPVIISRG
jgi:hypothetical protein